MRLPLRAQSLLFAIIASVATMPLLLLLEPYREQLIDAQRNALEESTRHAASALSREPLFDGENRERGRELYAYRSEGIIEIDGRDSDWMNLTGYATRFATESTLEVSAPYDESSLHFYLVIARDKLDLYLFVRVIDNAVVYREVGSLSVHRNDHVQLASLDRNANLRRFTIAPMQPGPATAFTVTSTTEGNRAVREEPRIEAHWLTHEQGYNLEIRIPLDMLTNSFSLSITDVDDPNRRDALVRIGTGSTSHAEDIGHLFIPPPGLEEALAGVATNASMARLVDANYRLLAETGNIDHAHGIYPESATTWLPGFLALKPAATIDLSRDDPARITDDHIVRALERTTSMVHVEANDSDAGTLTATVPVLQQGRIVAALEMNQNTNGAVALRNRFAETLILAMAGIGVTALFLFLVFATGLRKRIVRLSQQTGGLTDSRGRVRGALPAGALQDEIGDLRTRLDQVTTRLKQYNHYLEEMSKRLAHELRTPVTVVRSSLDNLEMNMETTREASAADSRDIYISRARQGIERLDAILGNMTEATRLEESLDPAETEYFDLPEVVSGCIEGYRIAYPGTEFEVSIEGEFEKISGLPELIAQMLDKLVSNAVDFAEPGTPVRVRLTRNSTAVIRVMNEGPGLPKDSGDKLFESMITARSRDTDEKAHLGLGLYIARTIAEFHGGSISIHNRDDIQGVVVTVRLPLMRITGKG